MQLTPNIIRDRTLERFDEVFNEPSRADYTEQLILQLILNHARQRGLSQQATCFEFLECTRNKYDRGQAEHGGVITDRDLSKEIHNELMDLWCYYQAQKMKPSP